MSQSFARMSQPGNREELLLRGRRETEKPQEEAWHERYELRGSRTDL